MPESELLVRPAPAPTWRDRVVAARAFAWERPAAVVASVVGVMVLAVGAWLVLRAPSVSSPPPELTMPRADAAGGAGVRDGLEGAGSTTTVASVVVVHVAGAVVRPGLVRLRQGARVADAVDAAGGLRADADLDRLNLAALVVDGSRVWVPIIGQEPPPEVGASGGGGAGGVGGGGSGPAIVDLNAASATELESLPGIGPATAQAILDQRRRVGRFRSVDDLLDVRGIGPAKLAAIRDRVRV